MRIDKFLQTVRVFKTRTDATEACKRGEVLLQGSVSRPAKEVKVGDVFSVRKPPAPAARSFAILQIPKSRISASLLPDYLRETTSAADKELLNSFEQELQWLFSRDK